MQGLFWIKHQCEKLNLYLQKLSGNRKHDDGWNSLWFYHLHCGHGLRCISYENIQHGRSIFSIFISVFTSTKNDFQMRQPWHCNKTKWVMVHWDSIQVSSIVYVYMQVCESDSAALLWSDCTCSSVLIDRCCQLPLNVANMDLIRRKGRLTVSGHKYICHDETLKARNSLLRQCGEI